METEEKKKQRKIRYIKDALEELSPDILDLLYRIVFYAQSGIE